MAYRARFLRLVSYALAMWAGFALATAPARFENPANGPAVVLLVAR